MLDIVLFEPEIPPNTGNIIRLCANTGCRLHLVEPLGFWLDDRELRRAGLDYREFAAIRTYRNWEEWLAARGEKRQFVFTTQGGIRYDRCRFEAGDALVFGPESRSLPADILEGFAPERRLRLPMVPESRSLNLANAASIAVYEALRQLDFPGAH